jgi:hypothetical protein
MQKLKEIEAQLHESPDQQISLTDPDARSMATSGRGTGTVGYNVQTAVDEQAGITTFVPNPLISGSKAEGRFGKQDFIYLIASDEYRCPAGQLPGGIRRRKTAC